MIEVYSLIGLTLSTPFIIDEELGILMARCVECVEGKAGEKRVCTVFKVNVCGNVACKLCGFVYLLLI